MKNRIIMASVLIMLISVFSAAGVALANWFINAPSVALNKITVSELTPFSENVLKVSEDSAQRLFHPLGKTEQALKSVYVSAETLVDKNFNGEYVGNAVEMGLSSNANVAYSLKYPYWYSERLAEYDYLSFWVCVQRVSNVDGMAALTIDSTNGSNIVSKAIQLNKNVYEITFNPMGSSGYATNTWYKLRIPMPAVLKCFGNSGVIPLIGLYVEKADVNLDKLLIGDVTAENDEFDSNLLAVNTQTSRYFYLNNGIKSKFVSSQELTSKNFKGEYDGNAVKFDYFNSQAVYAALSVDYTDSGAAYKFADLMVGYKYVNIRFCVERIRDEVSAASTHLMGDGILCDIYNTNQAPGRITLTTGNTTSFRFNQWHSVLVPVAKITEAGKINAAGALPLLSFYSEVGMLSSDSIYVGDIMLVNESDKDILKPDGFRDNYINGSANKDKFINGDVPGTFVNAYDMNLDGNYRGNALKFNVGGSQAWYKLKVKTSDYIDKGYTHIGLWFAVENTTESLTGYMQLAQGENRTLIETTFGGDKKIIMGSTAGKYAWNTWHKIMIPISALSNPSILSGEDIHVLDMYCEGVTAATHKLYIGEITAETMQTA